MKKLVLMLVFMAFMVPWMTHAQVRSTISIGTGTTNGNTVPFNNYYKNSFQESIYLKDEINAIGVIDSIAFHCSTGDALTLGFLQIYLAHVPNNAIASTTDWVPRDSMRLVYSGSSVVMPTAAGWYKIPLNSSFAYNGHDNLAVIVRKKSANYSSTLKWYYSNTTDNTVLYRNSDSDTSYANYPGSSAGSLSKTRANIRISMNQTGTPCLGIRDITYQGITYNSVNVTWEPYVTGFGYEVVILDTLSSGNNPDLATPISTTNLTHSFTGLSPNTVYGVYVRKTCGGNVYSPWKTMMFKTNATPTSLPYNNNFEDVAENGSWRLENGTLTNKWFIDTVAHNGTGTRGLYISSDRGATNGYDNTNSTCVYAWREITINPGEYAISFDWRCMGESSFDYIRVALVSGATTLTASSISLSGMSATSLPTGWIALDGGSKLNLSSFWQTNTSAFRVDTLGNYKLVFCWRTDGSGGVPPAAAIDNIMIDQVTCNSVDSVLITNRQSTSVDINPHSVSGSDFALYYKKFTGNAGYDTLLITAPYTLSDLSPSTYYSGILRTNCGSEDYSIAAYPIQFGTECARVTQFPWDFSFETTWMMYATGTQRFPYCWDVIDAGNTTYNWRSSTTPYRGMNSANFSGSSDTNVIHNDWLFTPELQLTGNQEIEFWARGLSSTTTSGYRGNLSIYASTTDATSQTDTAHFVRIPISASTPRITITGQNWTKYTVPLDAFTGSTYLAFVVDTNSYSFYVDDIRIKEIATCPEPARLKTLSLTSDEATVAWFDTVATSWTVEYGLKDFALGEGTFITATDTFLTISGLEVNTNYDFYVTGVCPDGSNSSISYVGQFKTDCLPFDATALPYTENFNSYTEGVSTGVTPPSNYPNHTLPSCWTFTNMSSSSTVYPIVFLSSNSGYPVSGNCLFFKSSNSTPIYAALPVFEEDINLLRISFAYRHEGVSTANGILTLGVMTDPSNPSSFIPVESYPQTTTITTINHDFALDTLRAGNYCIAFRYTGGTAQNMYLSIDNVTLSYAPTCLRSINLTSSNFTSSSADLNWFNTTGDSYTIAYSTRERFNPDTCRNTVTSNTLSTTLTGLNPYTRYYYAVKANCGSESGQWSLIESFITEVNCGTLTNVEPIVGLGTSTSSTYPMNTSTSNPRGITWQIYTQRELEALGVYSGTINNIAYQYTTTTNMNASLKVYMAEVDIDQMEITDTLSLNQMTLTYNGSMVFTDDQDWTEIEFTNSFAYSGTRNLMIAVERNAVNNTSGSFKYHSITGVYRTIYSSTTSAGVKTASRANGRNNIRFNVCTTTPTCFRPNNVSISNIQPTQTTVHWTSSASHFQIAYGPTDFILGGAAQQMRTATTQSITLSNLNPATPYDVYVRAICGPADTSVWSYVESFNTACLPSTLPYADNFDSYTTGISTGAGAPASYPDHTLPSCWHFLSMSTNSTEYPQVFISSNSSYVVNGNCLFLRSSSTTPVYSILPKMNAPIDSLMISFAYRNESMTATNGILTLGVMTDLSNASSFIPLESFPVNNTITYIDHVFRNDTVTGLGYHIAFKYAGPNNNMYLGIDEIQVDYAPSCLKPVRLTVDSTSATTASISWASSASNFIVDYKLSTDNQWTSITGITTPYTTIRGLQAAAEYDYRVKALCGAGDSSTWSYPNMFTTSCGARTLPYLENFESTTFPSQCWTRYTRLVSGVFSGDTLTPTTSGWSRVTLSNGLSGNHAKINIYGTAARYWLVTPEIDITNATAELTFDLALTKFGSAAAPDSVNPNNKFMVIVSTDAGATWAEANAVVWGGNAAADSVYRNIPRTGQTVTIPLAQYTGNVIKIAFYGESTQAGGDNDLHIDNISVHSTCADPTITSIVPQATSATVAWDGGNANYQVSYRETSATSWTTPALVTTATYTFTALLPETSYAFKVRRICGSQDTSMWTLGSFTTLELPCTAPTNIAANNITYTGATISWTDASQNQVSWKVMYGFGTNWDTITVTTASSSLSDLYADTRYTVRIMGYCSVESDVHSDWSEPFLFTTSTCQGVTNVAATEIKSDRATISWTPGSGQTTWEISYGTEGTNEENGTKVTVTGPSTHVITGLLSNMTYDVYIRNICSEGITSAWTSKYQFRTSNVGIHGASGDGIEVRIYPNPATNETMVSVGGIEGKVELVVTDMNGRRILTETVYCQGELVKTLDVSKYAKGAYFVNIYTETFNTTRKLIVR